MTYLPGCPSPTDSDVNKKVLRPLSTLSTPFNITNSRSLSFIFEELSVTVAMNEWKRDPLYWMQSRQQSIFIFWHLATVIFPIWNSLFSDDWARILEGQTAILFFRMLHYFIWYFQKQEKFGSLDFDLIPTY